jgi:hypothetical protein
MSNMTEITQEKATNEVREAMSAPLEYKEPDLSAQGERTELQLEDQFGKLPTNRWKNVGRTIFLKLSDDATGPTSGDDFYQFHIPFDLNDAILVRAEAAVTTASSSGGPITIAIRNGTGDMLTTNITIDDNEATSYTAATRSQVSNTNKVVHTGDLIHVDVDDAGSGAMGLQLFLSFQ